MSNRTIIPAEVDAIYQKELLYRATHRLVHEKYAKDLTIESNGGSRVVRFRRYSNLNPATTPLTEGVTPTGVSPTTTTITKTLAQYGSFTPFTDVVTMESVDSVLSELTSISGDQMGETKDVLCREALYSGTNIYYGGGKLSRVTVATGDYVTDDMLEKIVEGLKNNKAMRITPIIQATDGVGTSAVGAAYIAFCSPNITRQLKLSPSWTPVKDYARNSTIDPNEVGSTDGIRWIETTNSKIYTGAGASGINVHGFVVFGQYAYGKVPMNGSTAEQIIKPLGSGDDPINQRGTVGWKTTTGYLILNDLFLVRGEVAEKV